MPRRILSAAGFALILLLAYAPAQAEYGDVILNKQSEKNSMRPVVFPHWFHRIRFQCKVCHGELGFALRIGSTKVDMADIAAGKFCGKCHNGTIAWGADRCDLCHSGRPGLATGIIGGDRTAGPGKW